MSRAVGICDLEGHQRWERRSLFTPPGVLFGETMVFGAGLLVGTIRAEEGAKARQFREDRQVIATALAADPAWSNVSIDMYSGDGSAYLGGKAKTRVDMDRLRSRMLKLFGETRVEELVRAVDCP